MDCECCCDGDGVIACHECGYRSCSYCIDRYCKEKGEMACMRCHVYWDISVVMDKMPGYVNGESYREWRTEWLVRRETRRMVDTVKVMRKQARMTEIRERIRELEGELASCRDELREDEAGDGDGKEYIFHCRNNGCDGFQDETGECVACHTMYCTGCQEPDHSGTPCEKEKKLDWDLVRSVSRPCPECRVPIQKSSGCYQMWCTRCRTGFDWNTGNLITSNLHNPHYFESKPLEVLSWKDISSKVPHEKAYLWKSFCRFLKDIARPPTSEHVADKRREAWRIAWMKGEMTREKWREELFHHDMETATRRSFRNIISRLYKEGYALLETIHQSGASTDSMEEYRRWQDLTHSMLVLLKKGNDRIMTLNEHGQSFPVIRGFRLMRQKLDISLT